jgi:hypothetical protein
MYSLQDHKDMGQKSRAGEGKQKKDYIENGHVTKLEAKGKVVLYLVCNSQTHCYELTSLTDYIKEMVL